jgi:hypothetical protein
MGLTVLLLSGSRVLGCSAALAEICSVMLPLFAWLILMLLDGEIRAWSLKLAAHDYTHAASCHHLNYNDAITMI